MRSMRPSKNHERIQKISANPTMMMRMIIPTTNRMEPNGSSLKTSVSSSENGAAQQPSSLSSNQIDFSDGTTGSSITIPLLHPEDPNLCCIPPDLSPIYRPLPVVLRMTIGFVSTYLWASRSLYIRSIVEVLKTSSNVGIAWWLPIRFVRVMISSSAWAKKHVFFDLLKIFLKSYLLFMITATVVQDLLPTCRPARISISELVSKYNTTTLPSTYSNYFNHTDYKIANSRYNHPQQQQHPTVHYLKAMGDNRSNKTTKANVLDAIYLNHGFGASSLSWLPSIPILAQQLHTNVLLGHDAPGFGFTDRLLLSHSHNKTHIEDSQHVSYYSITNSANIGTTILRNHLNADTNAKNNSTTPTKHILLLGHSLGALTTLRMALQQQMDDVNIQQHIILVAPAIGLRKSIAAPTHRPPSVRGIIRRSSTLAAFVRRPLQRIGTSIACYGLKRLVGQRNFWRNGLQQAVWNSNRHGKNQLRDSDVVRYQWPAVVKDWEYGLVQFASEQATASSTTTQYSSDQELIQAVLNLPNVASLYVIFGANDRVIQNNNTIQFLRDNFPAVRSTVMENCGHNPFEEDPELFVNTVQSILLAASRGENHAERI